MEHHPQFIAPGDISANTIRQRFMSETFQRNVGALLSGEADIQLRQHQPDIFQDLHDYMAYTDDPVERRFNLPLPPNAGKSTMGVMFLGMAGIGQKPPGETQPLRSLTISPYRVSRRQILDDHSRFAPGVDVSEYQRQLGEDNLTHSSLLATYTALRFMDDHDLDFLADNLDLLELDEVHRAIGPQTSSQLKYIMARGRMRVLSMSATPNFNENHKACTVLDIRRTLRNPITPRDAIEIGVSNEVRLFALYSGEEITFTSKRENITEQDLSPLLRNEKRNDLIVSTMYDMGRLGRIGLVQCVPGEKSLHARLIAEKASNHPTQRIIDQQTGKERQLRIRAVGNFQSDKKNDYLIKRFKEGGLDGLTFTRYLTETFNHPIGYLITSPTTSEVENGQITGRAARLHDQVSYIFCLIDRYRTTRQDKRLLTPFDVFGESCINQGQFIAPHHFKRSPGRLGNVLNFVGQAQPRKHKEEEEDFERLFSKRVLEAMAALPVGTVLEDVLIVKTPREVPSEGYIPLNDLPAVQAGWYTPEGVRYILSGLVDDRDRPLFTSLKGAHKKQYVLADAAQRILAERYTDPRQKFTRPQIECFLGDQGWPRPGMDIVIGTLRSCSLNVNISKGTLLLKPAEAKSLLNALAEIPLQDPEQEVSFAEIARALGQASSRHLLITHRKRPDHDQVTRKRRRGLQPGAYKVVEALEVGAAVDFVDKLIARSPQLQEKFKDSAAQTIIDDLQYKMRQEMWRHKLRARLSQEAIQAFVSSVNVGAAGQPTPGEDPFAEANDLDESYWLSGYGRDWVSHSACINTEVDFASNEPATQAAAKEICQECGVKGDCLLFELRNPGGTVMAGFTAQERQRFDRHAAITWLKSTEPPASKRPKKR